MKLLLTSYGIYNKSIASALKRIAKGKIRIAFIPTAANVDHGDKEWLIKDLVNCRKLGPVDIVDISALPKANWLSRLKKANVIFVGGGNTVYLMKWIKNSGLKKELPGLLKTRVYVGSSAGSIVASRNLQACSDFIYGGEEKNAPSGLGLVDFHIRPHFNSPVFPKCIDKNLRIAAKKLSGDTYAIDDDSAVMFVDGKITVVSAGAWKKYSGKKTSNKYLRKKFIVDHYDT
ncbi:MAG: Type 1 glutamine amidotransferase-like domain-containing protein [Candidatus Aenigmarchaeota archaeon]|nr:Type 1 glutamine amidotransferase-like domain-containing protein [Candidatus Aenigmarchaeota archaeon]